MDDTKARVGDVAVDVLNQLTGSEPGSFLSDLRMQRGEVMRTIQGSYDALFEPREPSGLSHVERGVVALRAARLLDNDALRAHYRAYLEQLDTQAKLMAEVEDTTPGAPLSPRTLALLRHVDRLTNAPHTATPNDLAELQAHGLSTPDIVTLAQLIAFVNFQARTLVGLQLLAEAS